MITLLYIQYIQFVRTVSIGACKAFRSITDLITVHTPTRHHTRSANQLTLVTPRTELVTMGDRSFAKAAPTPLEHLTNHLKLKTAQRCTHSNID